MNKSLQATLANVSDSFRSICQLCRWDIGENIIAPAQVCNVNLCVKQFALFKTSRTLVEDREMIASLDKSQMSRG